MVVAASPEHPLKTSIAHSQCNWFENHGSDGDSGFRDGFVGDEDVRDGSVKDLDIRDPHVVIRQ